jgi:glutathione S-transferase
MNRPDVVVYGFPLSTYVNVVRLVLTHKHVPFEFRNLEPEMGEQSHLALHPFDRVPILEHGGFRVYETSAIALYVDDAFDGPALQPRDVRARARMHQWISALSSYYYPYAVYHLAHERLVFPALGIAPDEKVVAAALPRIRLALDVMERELEHGAGFLVADHDQPTLADFFLLPTLTGLSLIPEGRELLEPNPNIAAWRARMDALPSVVQVRSTIAPHFGKPVEHARKWVETHRPRY